MRTAMIMPETIQGAETMASLIEEAKAQGMEVQIVGRPRDVEPELREYVVDSAPEPPRKLMSRSLMPAALLAMASMGSAAASRNYPRSWDFGAATNGKPLQTEAEAAANIE